MNKTFGTFFGAPKKNERGIMLLQFFICLSKELQHLKYLSVMKMSAQSDVSDQFGTVHNIS